MQKENNKKHFYDLEALDENNNPIKMSTFKNKVLIITNVASECSYTKSSYENLKRMSDKFGDKIKILLFPSNQFFNQEPGTIEQIRSTVNKYLSDYVLFAKSDVKGKDANEVFKYLLSKSGNVFSNFFMWNFTKYLIDKEGNIAKKYNFRNLIKEEDIDSLINK